MLLGGTHNATLCQAIPVHVGVLDEAKNLDDPAMRRFLAQNGRSHQGEEARDRDLLTSWVW